MLTVEEALTLIEETVTQSEIISTDLAQARRKVLAESIVASVDSPPFDKALMDGFAVRAEDIDQVGKKLSVIERLTAGEVPSVSLEPGQAVQVMTGTQTPEGANAVVKIEDINSDEQDLITVNIASIAPGRNLLHQGESMQAGAQVLSTGTSLDFPQISLLAELGHSKVATFRQPTISILATGNEIVPLEQTPGPGQIRNSNEIMLTAQIENAFAAPNPLGIARDELDELRQKIIEGLNSDFLLLTGGVSAGTLDLVPKVLNDLGVQQVFHKVFLKPGKPIWFGKYVPKQGGKPCFVFGLPGNPISALVCFELFVKHALDCFYGKKNSTKSSQMARLQQAHLVKGDRPVYHPAKLLLSQGEVHAVPVRWAGSADIFGTSSANGMIRFSPREESYEQGELVPVQFWFLNH